VNSLNEKLQGTKGMSEQQAKMVNTQIDELKSQLAKKSALSSVVWVLIALLACAVGILVGKGCN